MLFQKHILSMAVILAMGAVPAFAAQTVKNAAPSSASKSASKPAAPKTHSVDGSLVVATDDALTIRAGKKDMSFKINTTTQKPTPMTPGSRVTVNYHDEGNQHIANSIQLAPTKSSATAAKSPASK